MFFLVVVLRRSAITTITKHAIITAITIRAVCCQLEPDSIPFSMFGCVGVAVGTYGLKVGIAVGFGDQVGCDVGDEEAGFPIVSVCVSLQLLCPTTIV